MTRQKGRIGSSFEDYLREEGVLAETVAVAVGRVSAWRSERTAEQDRIGKLQEGKGDDDKPKLARPHSGSRK